MLGDFISRGLVMILGYAYPAFECFKTVEKNKVHIDELRFWCQYWIIVALVSVIERFGDVFISWVPLYGEMKLAFIIYLWYPKTKGTSYVYERLLRPFVAKHETDIDKNLQELRFRAWDLAIYYYQNCTQLGQSAFFNVVEYIANQSSRLKGTEKQEKNHHRPGGSPPPFTGLGFFRRRRPAADPPAAPPNKRWPPTDQPIPSAPPLPSAFPSLFKAQAQAAKSNVVQMDPDEAQTEYVHVVEEYSPGSSPRREKSKHSSPRLKLRRSKPIS